MRTEYRFAPPGYSLHDMPVRFAAKGDTLTLATEYGMTRTDGSGMTDSGSIELSGLDWDFCWAYILSETGRSGNFTGEKLPLADLLHRYPDLRLEVIDEHFGYNSLRLCGYAGVDGVLRELAVEIYYAGALTYAAD